MGPCCVDASSILHVGPRALKARCRPLGAAAAAAAAEAATLLAGASCRCLWLQLAVDVHVLSAGAAAVAVWWGRRERAVRRLCIRVCSIASHTMRWIDGK
jgi:hypothetical protein